MAGIPDPSPELIDLPPADVDKFRKVLRLGTGDGVVVLPGDGRALRCELDGKRAKVIQVEHPQTDSPRRVIFGLAQSRPEKLEESVRMATEMGAAGFVIFPSDRSVVRWDESKREAKFRRLEVIAREASEVCFRTTLPFIRAASGLVQILMDQPEALVLSEYESVTKLLEPSREMTLIIGPEGGWAPREAGLIRGREVTLGPRVLRVDTAVAAAAALALLAP